MRRVVAMAALAASLVGCSGSPATSRCEELCAREAVCEAELARHRGDAIDPALELECARACAMFERDPESVERVDERVACVKAAGDCQAVLACADDEQDAGTAPSSPGG